MRGAEAMHTHAMHAHKGTLYLASNVESTLLTAGGK